MTVIMTRATLNTLWTWTTLTLNITLWLFHQHTVRELVLASLRINLHQLHLDLVTFLDASLFNCLKTLPINLRDVEQTILTRENLYETTVRHDRTNSTLVNLTNLWNSYDSLDLTQSSIDRILVRSRYLYVTLTISLLDSDSSTCILLHLLDNLTTRTDNSTNEFLRNIECYNTWNLWLHLSTWLRDCLHHAVEDVLTTSLSLHQSLLENLEAQTVALDIHLCSGQTIAGTCGLEVHITQVVLITEDITEDSILVLTWVLDKTHSNTRNWLLHRNTCIHQGECTGTNSSHRRRTIRLQDLAYQTNCVREVCRNLTLQTTPCQVTVTNLTTAYAALSLSLTCREWREVIVKEEALVALLEHTVDKLLIHLCTKSTCRERHSLTTLEDSASVRHWEWRHLAPDRADICSSTTIKTQALIEDATTHSIAHYVIIVAGSLSVLLLQVFLREIGMSCVILLKEISQNLVESILTSMLLQSLVVDIVSWLVKLRLNLLTEFLIVDLVVVLTLHVSTLLLSQLILELAHRLDSLGSHLEGTNEILLRNFLHLTFYHHDIVLGSTNHDIHVSLFHLLECRVDNILTIDTSHTNLRDVVLERNI